MLTDQSGCLNGCKHATPCLNTQERCMLWYYNVTWIFKTVNGLFHGIPAFIQGSSWITDIYSRGFYCTGLLISCVSVLWFHSVAASICSRCVVYFWNWKVRMWSGMQKGTRQTCVRRRWPVGQASCRPWMVINLWVVGKLCWVEVIRI